MPERLINAAADNPLGFWEPRDMVSLNDEILRTVGSGWDDVFSFRADTLLADRGEDFLPRARSVVSLNYAHTDLAVIKDPRLSLLVPLWREALGAEGLPPVFVIMVRDPMEVAQSIAARDGAPVQASMLAWLSHMVAVERDTRGARRLFVSYSELVQNWETVLDRLRHQFAMPLPISAEQAAEISSFLRPSARHHESDDASWVDRTDLWPGIAEAWRWAKTATLNPASPLPFPETVVRDLVSLEAQWGPVLQVQNARAMAREQELQAVIADRETAVLRLKAQVQEYGATVAASSETLAAARQEHADALAQIRILEKAESEHQRAAALVIKQAEDKAQLVHHSTIEELDAALSQIADLRHEAALIADEAEKRLRTTSAAAAVAAQEAEDRLRVTSSAASAASAAAQEAEERLRLAELAAEAAVSAASERARAASERAKSAQDMVERLSARSAELEMILAASEARASDLTTEKAAIEARADETSARLAAVTTRLDAVLSSSSWSVTRPLRVISKRYQDLTRGE